MMSGAEAARASAASSASATSPRDATITDAIGHAVKAGYDVIAENIQQGREAAAAFRQGQYNIRDVPGDLETVALRMIQLARELSGTTLDICERLLKEISARQPPQDRASEVPPFRPAPATPAAAKPAPSDPGLMKLTVRISGAPKAVARTTSLPRPSRPTAPTDLSATPLATRDGQGKPITAVSFETDVSVEGLVAVIAVPARQAPGVYSGLVYAKGDDVPLGALTIEIPK
jgi:hypothetical protein